MKRRTNITQFLTFTLAEEVFALDISTVREVLDYTPVTKVPQMPAYMRGVINLRGEVLPVLDMKLKFGLGEMEKNQKHLYYHRGGHPGR